MFWLSSFLFGAVVRLYFFFFSSRRRHTRWPRDWSSERVLFRSRHPIRQRRLADAARAADQPGVRNATAAIGFEQRLLGLAMAEQHGGLAWMRRLGIVARIGIVGA